MLLFSWGKKHFALWQPLPGNILMLLSLKKAADFRQDNLLKALDFIKQQKQAVILGTSDKIFETNWRWSCSSSSTAVQNEMTTAT